MRLPLLNLLRKDPLPAIVDLMDASATCAAKLAPLFEALEAGDHERIQVLARETSRLEHVADQKKNEVRDNMPSGLFMPIDRRDALHLVSEVDRIADCAEDVAVLLTLRRLDMPPGMTEPLHELVARVLDTVKAASAVVGTFERLQLADFEGPVALETLALVSALTKCEHEADKVQDRCAKTLFKSEKTLNPVVVFMWSKVLHKLGDVANHAENVGDSFRLFVADTRR